MSPAEAENSDAAPVCGADLGVPEERSTPRFSGIARVLDEIVFPTALVFGIVTLLLMIAVVLIEWD